jgi:hypothetical protein
MWAVFAAFWILYPKIQFIVLITTNTSISMHCCSGRVFFRLVGPVLMYHREAWYIEPSLTYNL